MVLHRAVEEHSVLVCQNDSMLNSIFDQLRFLNESSVLIKCILISKDLLDIHERSEDISETRSLLLFCDQCLSIQQHTSGND